TDQVLGLDLWIQYIGELGVRSTIQIVHVEVGGGMGTPGIEPHHFFIFRESDTGNFHVLDLWQFNIVAGGHLHHLYGVLGVLVDKGDPVGPVVGEGAAHDVPIPFHCLFIGAVGKIVPHQIGIFTAIVGGVVKVVPIG